ncbi:MAG: NAD-dependent epimerase/dehydratase family protein [Actinomycetota bacterium]
MTTVRPMRVLVTGGIGMLGAAAIRALLHRGHDAISVDIRPRSVDMPVIPHYEVDIADAAGVEGVFAAERIDAVIHTASLVDLHLGQPARLRQVNVDGTRNLLHACRRHNAARFVYVSSAEAIAGTEPLVAVTEAEAAYPYPHLTYYGVTKQAAEELVLVANSDDLATCALRTFGLFGPGDRTVVPRFLHTLPTRTVRLIGDGLRRGPLATTDVVYADNYAHALVLAVEQLEPAKAWAGTPLHVTDGIPVNIQRFLADLVQPLGYDLDERRYVPRWLVERVADVFAARYRTVPLERFARPPVSRHMIRLALDDYYLDATRIRRELGYEPPVDRATAVKATQAWLQDGRH